MDIFDSWVDTKNTITPRYVRFPALSGNHRTGTGSRRFRVPARRRKLLETRQRQDRIRTATCLKIRQNICTSTSCPFSKVNLYLVSYTLLFKTNHYALMDKL